MKENSKLRYLKYLGGQGAYFCQVHNKPLSTDYLKSRRICSFFHAQSGDARCQLSPRGGVLKLTARRQTVKKNILSNSVIIMIAFLLRIILPKMKSTAVVTKRTQLIWTSRYQIKLILQTRTSLTCVRLTDRRSWVRTRAEAWNFHGGNYPNGA